MNERHHCVHDLPTQTLTLIARMHSDINDLEIKTTVSYNSPHGD
jgi:hypothetical protein